MNFFKWVSLQCFSWFIGLHCFFNWSRSLSGSFTIFVSTVWGFRLLHSRQIAFLLGLNNDETGKYSPLIKWQLLMITGQIFWGNSGPNFLRMTKIKNLINNSNWSSFNKRMSFIGSKETCRLVFFFGCIFSNSPIFVQFLAKIISIVPILLTLFNQLLTLLYCL